VPDPPRSCHPTRAARRTLRRTLWGAAFAWLAAASPATAELRDHVAQGTITARSGGIFDAGCLPSAAIGAPFRLDYRFEDALPDVIASPTWGAYPSIYYWNLAFEDVNDAAVGNAGGVDVFDDQPFSGELADKLEITFLNLQTWPAPCTASTTGLVLRLIEQAPTAPTPLDSDAQPVLPPDPEAFTTAREVVFEADGALLEMTIERLDVLGTPRAPVLPYATTTLPDGRARWHFDTRCTTACWVDPPVTDGFVYEAQSARFPSIDDFPSGFDAPFDVWVEDDFVGTFGPGDRVDFSGEPGGGVARFTIRGITPGVDAEDVRAFPLRLSLDASPATFTMTSLETAAAVPALPAGGAAVLAALLGLSGAGAAQIRRAGN